MAGIGVLGAGTWGMALTRMLENSGHDVTVWSALKEEVDTYSRTRRHPNLPGMVIPDGVAFTENISEAVSGRDLLIFAVPSVFVRSTAAAAAEYIPDGQLIVDVAKGIEPETHFMLTEVIADEVVRKAGKRGVKLVALSGPTHAEEVARDIPTMIVSAGEDMRSARKVQDIFMNTCMRVYTNPDVRGVELCGALKNIVALAAGMSDGLGYGDNTKAALITRGMAEIARLGMAMGCQEQTFYGLAGIGDLIVTATSVHSRNNRAGRLIGQGMSVEDAVRKVGMVVEGINAIPAAMELCSDYEVRMPILQGVFQIVKEGTDPRKVVRELMEREGKPETLRM